MDLNSFLIHYSAELAMSAACAALNGGVSVVSALKLKFSFN